MDEPVERREQRRAPLEVGRPGRTDRSATRPSRPRRLRGRPPRRREPAPSASSSPWPARSRARRAAARPSAARPPRPAALRPWGRRGQADPRGARDRHARRSRPRRGIIRNSSICVTLRLFVQPDEAHGTTQVSGISREASGPDFFRSSRMSRRNRSLSRNQTRERLVVRERVRTGEVETEVADRPDHGVELEQRPVVLEGVLELLRPVRRAEAAPEYEVCAGRDRGGRVDLQHGQAIDDRQAGLSAAANRAAGREPRCAGPAPSSAAARARG